MADVLGIIAFVIASLVGSFEIYRSFVHLRMKVSEVEIVRKDSVGCLALFHLTFVNPSILGKTVCRFEWRAPKDVTIVEPHRRYSENRNFVRFLLPNFHDWSVLIPTDEILQLSLDIPPNQSVNRWLGIWLTPNPYKDTEAYTVEFVALTVNRRVLAKCKAYVSNQAGLYENPCF